jgi:hypothetical protein
MGRVSAIALILVGFLAINSVDAVATTVRLNGNVIVSDTYEGDTVGNSVVADVGLWSNNGDFWWFPRTKGVVSNAGSPSAIEGTQYGSIGGTPSQQLAVDLTLALGDTIQFESMVYIPAATSAQDYPWQFVIFGGSNAASDRLLDFYRYSNGTWESGSVAGTYAGPASYAADVWQHWVLDFKVGDPSATLTIDGVSASIPASHTNLVNSAGLLSLFTNGPSLVHWDAVAVPESSSYLILVIGAGGLAVVTRFKRFGMS